MELIDKNELYKLFENTNGIIKLHVSEVDNLPTVDVTPQNFTSIVPTIVSCNLYDKETIYTDCTVQVLENSVTGEVSVGWWENQYSPYTMGGRE